MHGRMKQAISPAGYSGTPLAKKLGIKQGFSVYVCSPPPGYEALLAPLPPNVTLGSRYRANSDLVHVFVVERDRLVKELTALRSKLNTQTPVWVSWPKKASKVPTTVTEDVIREVALPMGYVDVKVCAVSEIWSALKLVVRKELR